MRDSKQVKLTVNGFDVHQFNDDGEICTLLNGFCLGTFERTWEDAALFLERVKHVLNDEKRFIQNSIWNAQDVNGVYRICETNYLVSSDWTFREQIGPVTSSGTAKLSKASIFYQKYVSMFERTK